MKSTLHVGLLWLLFMLIGCASSDAKEVDKLSKAKTHITDAATTPLNDFNLVQDDIPPVLVAAQKAPYLPPVNQTCDDLLVEVHELDAVLGADLDMPSSATPGLIERGTVAAGNAAVGMLRGAAEDVVPYRNWVRKLSGAERYSKDVAAAVAAGVVRRAFLKGVGQASGCNILANPVVVNAPES